jgi:hypothetical protein
MRALHIGDAPDGASGDLRQKDLEKTVVFLDVRPD